jgi:hypothetical protein
MSEFPNHSGHAVRDIRNMKARSRRLRTKLGQEVLRIALERHRADDIEYRLQRLSECAIDCWTLEETIGRITTTTTI